MVAKYSSDGYDRDGKKVTMRVRVPEDLFRKLKARQMELPYEVSLNALCAALIKVGLRVKETK